MRRSLLSTAAVSAVLAAAACGGGDDRLSREELVEEGDAICVEYESRVDEIEEIQGPDDVERYVDEARPVIEEGTDELDALTPPEELEDDYDRWISLTREGVASLDELEAAAAAGDAEGLQEIVESLDDSEAEADSLAQEIGFQECGGED
jgi:hypothetical protein